MAENAQAAAGNENKNQPQFALQRIYVKDLSLESPNAPTVFQLYLIHISEPTRQDESSYVVCSV